VGSTGGIGWREIEIARSANGRPDVVLHGSARAAARQFGVSAVLLSISHTDTQAVAVVVLAQ
jgi:holo-[acyl-carrier protein] synthase